MLVKNYLAEKPVRWWNNFTIIQLFERRDIGGVVCWWICMKYRKFFTNILFQQHISSTSLHPNAPCDMDHVRFLTLYIQQYYLQLLHIWYAAPLSTISRLILVLQPFTFDSSGILYLNTIWITIQSWSVYLSAPYHYNLCMRSKWGAYYNRCW